ncbi:unnamed protein product, partial [marine sediment metagenome]
RPHAVKKQPIPKPGSKEKHVLEIGGIFDRTVAKALKKALEPLWEGIFLDGSWGFRPKRGTWPMLAELEARMIRLDRWVICIDDIRRAFDNTRVDDVLDAHQRMFASELKGTVAPAAQGRLLGFIAAVTQGADPDRQIGISQGNPFSPLALNAVMHYAHDMRLLDNLERPV